MKRIFAVILVLLIALSVCGASFSAADSAQVYVTIADKDGKLAVAAEKIAVTDIDADSALTINDVLYAAHEKFYEGGAAAGYATEDTQWGLSLAKLWGAVTGGSYGYMVNNVAAYSMTDPVVEGDYVAAYVFTEPEKLLDKYTYFDKFMGDVKAGDVTLTLTKADFDKDWNPITVPVEGAEITVDGAPTGAKTDKDGKVTFSLGVNGKHLVSATAAGQVNVPPVFIATVTGGVDPTTATESPTVAPTQASTQKATQAPTQKATTKAAATATGSNTNAVKTGGSPAVYVVSAFAVLALAVAFLLRKKNET